LVLVTKAEERDHLAFFRGTVSRAIR
jgi:hypothetical protein